MGKKDNQSTPQEGTPTQDEIAKLEKQVNRLEELIIQSGLRDISYHYTNKKEIIKVNLLAGLTRGIGFTVGTALFLAMLFYVLNYFVSFPIIGEYIADFLDMIDTYRSF